MSFIRRAVLAAVLSALTSAAAPAAVTGVVDPPRSPRNASYTIAARLDPATRTITATETIAWRNITGQPTAARRSCASARWPADLRVPAPQTSGGESRSPP
jgi:hypothetical protein